MPAILTLAGFGVVGWALCGATMAIAMRTLSLGNALIVHAVAAPVFFGLLSWGYAAWFGYTGPLPTAAIFLAIVVVLDVFVVALLVRRSFEMFRSLPGTWLPFALIFVSSWLVGAVAG